MGKSAEIEIRVIRVDSFDEVECFEMTMDPGYIRNRQTTNGARKNGSDFDASRRDEVFHKIDIALIFFYHGVQSVCSDQHITYVPIKVDPVG